MVPPPQQAKRPAEGEPVRSPPAHPSDYSASVKKKLTNSTRTGQACDRCKIRKIRCDGRAGGCSPCLQNNTECKTTDRITGRATVRGHTEALEIENQHLKSYVYELQQQVKDLGGDFKPMPRSMSYPISPPQGQNWVPATPQQPSRTQVPWSPQNNGTTEAQGRETNLFRALPAFRTGCNGDNYLGVSSANSVLSPIKGTSMSLFGMEIDIADFAPNHIDDTKSPAAYNQFLAIVYNRKPRDESVRLPQEYNEAEMYATWYFRSLHPYTPCLWKPTFMTMLSRIYNDQQFRPSYAEIVQVHMVIALIQYQFSVRNADQAALVSSHSHYSYALSFVHELIAGHTLADVQALTMIAVHIRNFPKPGAAWFLTHTAFGLAVELGLHRSVKAWADPAPKMDELEIETRRRVFWVLHGLYIGLSGKLGRPMSVMPDDIDVEPPNPINDNLPSEEPKCSFLVGLQICKIWLVYAPMYKTIYSVNPPSAHLYESTVRRLHEDLQKWRRQIPPELADPAQAVDEDRIFSLYLQVFASEARLLLHHPAICRSPDPNVIRTNLDESLGAATDILRVAEQVNKYKCLDSNWMQLTVHLAAIFTTLFVWSQRQDKMTSTEYSRLNSDMASWLEIMGEYGNLLGSGKRLQEAIRAIVEQAMRSIGNHVTKKSNAAAAAAIASASLKQIPQQQQQTQPPNRSTSISNAEVNDVKYITPPEERPVAAGSASYPQQAQYAYPDPSTTSMPPYPPNPTPMNQPAYQVPDSNIHTVSQDPPAQTYMYQNATTANHNVPSYSTSAVPHPDAGSDMWRQWTQNISTNMGHSDYLGSASVLMSMAGRDVGQADGGVPTGQGQGVQPVSDGIVSTAAQQAAQAAVQQGQAVWPLMMFNISQNGGTQQ